MTKFSAKTDENVLKLLHYFVVEEDYNPIIIHGGEDEIWLENVEAEYNVIRICSKYIHNEEQLDFDYDKVEHIIKGIKKKALLLKINMLNVFTNVNEDLNLESGQSNIIAVNVKKMKDIYSNKLIIKAFPNIKDKTSFLEKGEDLIMKISDEINKKNIIEAKKSEKIFKNNTPVITYALIALNILVFLAMYVLGEGSLHIQTLVDFGASYPPFIRNGEYYRLITSGFLHIGFMHLLFNNYALYIIGPQVENFFGRIKFLTIYFGSIFIASLMSMLFFEGVSAGASGAIFGLLGAILYFGYHYRVYLGNALRSQIIPLIILNLLIGFSIESINDAAHIGGLIGGVIVAALVGVTGKTSKFEQLNAGVIGAILTGFLIYLGFFNWKVRVWII